MNLCGRVAKTVNAEVLKTSGEILVDATSTMPTNLTRCDAMKTWESQKFLSRRASRLTATIL
jgi:hypothetical protein